MTATPQADPAGEPAPAMPQGPCPQPGKTLILANPKPLSAGSYTVNWYAAGADTHRRNGSFSFSAK